ncbi:MAG: DNA-directed RNA polymerase subunit D [Candidatus Methanomethylophilaceae archaeon]|nr:DNA-directed RNA polymerase subunit D [Candidatus Methanomethylophilaceae archaeon]
MDIEIIEMAERKAKFILRNSSPAMANALRRTLLSDLPKMAIHKVDFYLGPLTDDNGRECESSTPLFDEIIAHRLGMIPVPTDLDLFVPQEECTCGGAGCPNCTIEYFLNKSGPCTVYSGDLLPMVSPELREKFKVKDEFIPIVELINDQGVNISATAVMGTAKRHVKWQVCNGVGYKYMPVVRVDPAAASRDDVLECRDVCPKKVFDVKDGRLVVVDEMGCSLCRACTEHVKDGGVTVTGDDTTFLFKFETDGSYTAQQALDEALKVLRDEAKEFAEQIENIGPESELEPKPPVVEGPEPEPESEDI